MRRRAARTDDNQVRIVDALRRAGVQVRVISMVGEGVPDLLTCHRGVLRLVEVKDGAKSPSKQKLTALQEKFAKTWPVFVVKDEAEAMQAHGIEVAS